MSFYKTGFAADIYPETGYQTGATPELIERARDHSERISQYTSENKPITPQPPPSDQKWRYFWRIGVFITFRKDPLVIEFLILRKLYLLIFQIFNR
jgi:hypothetical protein